MPKDQLNELELLKRAADIALQYRLVITPHGSSRFVGNAVELPGIVVEASTIAECGSTLQEALLATVARMLHEERVPPLPSQNSTRTEQVNIRMTSQERLLLDDAARRHGHRGISDFLRSLGLRELSR
jgi:predicted RNase H-like HicB family nuclease